MTTALADELLSMFLWISSLCVVRQSLWLGTRQVICAPEKLVRLGTKLSLTFLMAYELIALGCMFLPMHSARTEFRGLVSMRLMRGVVPVKQRLRLATAFDEFRLKMTVLTLLLTRLKTLGLATDLRVVVPLGPLNRPTKHVPGALRVTCLVQLTQNLGRLWLMLEWASMILVFTVPRPKTPLWSTPLGIMRTSWQFPRRVISVSVTLAPLVAFLISALLGWTPLVCLVFLTTVSLTWLPTELLGPTYLSPRQSL